MPCLLSRRRLLQLCGLGLLPVAAGCGTILYPERIGQPRGPLDWKVVALDTLGLLLFFIPGIIAFAVDFSNGTIYMPSYYGPNSPSPSSYYGADAAPSRDKKLVSVQVPPTELSQAKIEQVVSKHLDRTVRLDKGDYQTQELESVEQFWPTHDSLTAS